MASTDFLTLSQRSGFATIRIRRSQHGTSRERSNALSIGNKKTQALVIYLALKIGGRPTFKEIGDLIAGGEGDAEARARESVRELQMALRFLPPGILVEGPDSVRFNRDVVVINHAPAFSPPIAPGLQQSIRDAYPQSQTIGPFEVRWVR